MLLPQTPEERSRVEQMLGVFGTSTEYVPHLKAILDNSRSPYAQHFATSNLLKLVTDHTIRSVVALGIGRRRGWK